MAIALHAHLVHEFGNKPRAYKNKEGCGSRNCFAAGVQVHGPTHWQSELRATLSSAQPAPCGLPDTVGLRVPKASNCSRFSSYRTLQHRDELGLTLRAAALDIAPRVCAEFPVDVVSEVTGAVVEHAYGYIFEDGWVEFERLLETLSRVHTDADDRKRAGQVIGERVVQLLTDVSRKAGYVMLDVKNINMVGRRVPGAALDYEVRMIDFSPEYVANVNLHANTTSSGCVFSVNALLFLNQVMGRYATHMRLFSNLVRMMERTWDSLELRNGSFCALLDADTERVYKELPPWTSLMRVPAEHFHAALRFTFYRVLQQYGDADLMQDADRFRTARFVTRYVRLVVYYYANF